VECVRQTISGNALRGVINIPPTLYNKRVEVIVLPLEDIAEEKPNSNKRQLGFWDGPPLPDSFFEPLPEEELQAWGM